MSLSIVTIFDWPAKTILVQSMISFCWWKFETHSIWMIKIWFQTLRRSIKTISKRSLRLRQKNERLFEKVQSNHFLHKDLKFLFSHQLFLQQKKTMRKKTS